MPTTPPRRRRQPNPQTPPSRNKRRNGLFYNNEWWCNCDPRQKAVRREVRSDLPTRGQWFYTCARQPRCKFFLWEDEARQRDRGRISEDIGEEVPPPELLAPVLTQRRLTSLGFEVQPGSTQAVRRDSDETAQSSEVEEISPPDTPSPARRGSDGPTLRSRAPVPNGESSQTGESSNSVGATLLRSPMQVQRQHQAPPSSPSKRKRTDVKREQNVIDLSDMDSEEERELAELADQSAKKFAASRDKGKAPENPYETPAAVRTVDVEGLPTPVTGHRVARNLFPEAGADGRRTVAFDTPGSSPSDAAGDMVSQVLGVLRPHVLPTSTMDKVSDVLNTAARRMEGMARGREAARETVRRKEEDIARMQERIRALENKEKMYETQLTSMKVGLRRLYQDH